MHKHTHIHIHTYVKSWNHSKLLFILPFNTLILLLIYLCVISGFFCDGKWDLRFSGMLCSADRQFHSEVLGQNISTIFKGETVPGHIACPEMSEWIYRSTLRKIPEECISYLSFHLTHWNTQSSLTRPVSPFVSICSRLRDDWDIVVVCL